ncbi:MULTISPECIES: GTPase-associated protein 1-related protein [Thermomonospora]|mgnify:CR=1 FL=1|uniref:Uncharacterized protein n=1 Tax=Thermomonospora curvata (strain ATCC 19995 / DSM 43183 / JCM 3096 / KCTC 9072 / NBRC 15933 / NCIMB 10081 / Henssen B9) TaxID=471852 RepID=D1AA43_THECD|nr:MULTISPECIES: GTPase-associated protein 1-related protein [Thermomonospora]ACY96979.1 hypothetical protein Tcur_1398 [Thermomonospora curvata DSM 43183]PKK15255.1 MAG: hypothetical protein BUE48_006825 [Thermomonospora sp. CIF 1]
MRFHQLYYTSCRTGLSGFAGYQFNAVTPGVSAQVMHQVEEMGSYEPPTWLENSPDPDQITSCPVNLCFEPGPTPVLAHTVFTGTDYSGRFGNYFVHAVVPADAARWPGPPPIELWGAPWWTHQIAESTELPALEGPLRPGPLDRAAVDAFLKENSRSEWLPLLLVAVERAVLDQDRSVVIHAADTTEIVHWIAAVSHLLPPPLTAAMSFATYQFRPAYSRRHLIGTVPGADFTVDRQAFESFYLFDCTSGRASDLEPGPLPRLLAGAGAVRAEALWRRAEALADGTERRLADWYPVAAAAALLEGLPLEAGDLEAVCAWLCDRDLDAETVGRLGAALVGHRDLPVAQLQPIAALAASRGLAELLTDTETALITARVRGRPAPLVTLRSPAAREHATALCTQRLTGADLGVLTDTLGLAAGYGLRLDPGLLRDQGLRVLGPRLAERVDPQLCELLERWPALRAGALAHLAALARTDLSRMAGVLADGLEAFTGAVPETELKAHPALHEATLIARARREPRLRIQTLLSILERRPLDATLPAALWPEGWSVADAAEILPRLPERDAASTVLADWVTPLLAAPFTGGRGAAAEERARLHELVERQPVGRALSTDLRRRAAAVRWVRQTAQAFTRASGDEERIKAAAALVAGYHGPAAPARDYLLLRLSELLPRLPGRQLARQLGGASDEVRRACLEGMDRALDGEEKTAVTAAANAFVLLHEATAHGLGEVAEVAERMLAQRLPHWRGRRLRAVARAVGEHPGLTAGQFQRWLERHRPPARNRLPHLLWRRRERK